MLENFHQNIIYDNQTALESPPQNPALRFISSTDDVHAIGTICKISFQKFEE
jgi:hypothetical protein